MEKFLYSAFVTCHLGHGPDALRDIMVTLILMNLALRFKRLILSSLAIFGGLMIVVLSLLSAASAKAISQEADNTTSGKRFYFNQPIRPDHVLYPVIAIKDRLEFATTDTDEDKIAKQLELADERLEDAYALVESEQIPMVLPTLIKAEQYVFNASAECHLIKDNEQIKTNIVEKAKLHDSKLEAFFDILPVSEHQDLSELQHKLKQVVEQLEQ